MVNSQRGVKYRVGYNNLISNKHEWNNCFIKNSHKISIKIKVLTLFCKKKKQQNEDVQVTSGLAMV